MYRRPPPASGPQRRVARRIGERAGATSHVAPSPSELRSRRGRASDLLYTRSDPRAFSPLDSSGSPTKRRRHRRDLTRSRTRKMHKALASSPLFFRKKVGFIESVESELDLRNYRALHFEKLSGDRSGQHSIRLNDQWRLILRLERDDDGRLVVVVESSTTTEGR